MARHYKFAFRGAIISILVFEWLWISPDLIPVALYRNIVRGIPLDHIFDPFALSDLSYNLSIEHALYALSFFLMACLYGSILGMVYASVIKPKPVIDYPCPRCRYDLRGTPNHCPECGWRQPETYAEIQPSKHQRQALFHNGHTCFVLSIILFGYFMISESNPMQRHQNFFSEAWTLLRFIELLPMWLSLIPAGAFAGFAALRLKHLLRWLSVALLMLILLVSILICYNCVQPNVIPSDYYKHRTVSTQSK